MTEIKHIRMNSVIVSMSIGELFDKISILMIKMAKITDFAKKQLVEKEYLHLSQLMSEVITSYGDESVGLLNKLATDNQNKLLTFLGELYRINNTLWNIEDNLRRLEKEKRFDTEFIELARKVYLFNDERAKIKREINEMTNSVFKEVKEYIKYEQ